MRVIFILIFISHFILLSHGKDISNEKADLRHYQNQTSYYKSSKDELLLWKDFCDANFDREGTFLRYSELKKIDEKSEGFATGEVVQDESEVIWFIKQAQVIENEYLGAKLMNLLVGQSTPEVKLIEEIEGYTASKKILKFVTEETVINNKNLNKKSIIGRIKLYLAMDLIGLEDRHDQNMGYRYIEVEDRLEAIRVDFDDCFNIDDDHYDTEIYDEALSEKQIEGVKVLEIAIEELLAIPDQIILKTLSEGIDDLMARAIELDIEKYQQLGLRLVKRKDVLRVIYEKVKCIDMLMEKIKCKPDLAKIYEKIISSSYGVPIILVDHPELLTHEEISPQLWDKILASKKSASILRLLVKHPELLYYEKIKSESWDKILAFEDSASVLKVVVEHPDLMDHNKMTPEFWDKLLACSGSAAKNAASVLRVLGKHPELLDNRKISIEFWSKILQCDCSTSVLRLLGEHPEWLNHEKVTTEFLVQLAGFYSYDDFLEGLKKKVMEYI